VETPSAILESQKKKILRILEVKKISETRKQKNHKRRKILESRKEKNLRNLGTIEISEISKQPESRNLETSEILESQNLGTSLPHAKTRRKIIYMLPILTFILAGCILYNILCIHQFLSFIHRLIKLFDPRGIKIPVQSNFLSFLCCFRNCFPRIREFREVDCSRNLSFRNLREEKKSKLLRLHFLIGGSWKQASLIYEDSAENKIHGYHNNFFSFSKVKSATHSCWCCHEHPISLGGATQLS
jgi:hypothetical protein